MIDALTKAFAQLPQPELRRPMLLSMIAALVMVFFCGIFSWLLFDQFSFFGIGLLDDFIALLGTTVFVLIAFLFYPSTVMVVAGFFLDSVADAVETRHYPGLSAPRQQSFREILSSALMLLGITVILNLLLLPLYIVALLVPGLNLLIFYLANGYLFGREFFGIIAGRRLTPVDAVVLRQSKKWTIFTAGVVIVVLTTIPIVNLAAPIVGTAFMVHVFHRLRRNTMT